MGKQWQTLFLGVSKSLWMVIAAMKLKDAYSLEGKLWQPTPVLLPGESHGGKSLVGYSPWGRKESDTTELLHFLSLISPELHRAHSAPWLCRCLGMDGSHDVICIQQHSKNVKTTAPPHAPQWEMDFVFQWTKGWKAIKCKSWEGP